MSLSKEDRQRAGMVVGAVAVAVAGYAMYRYMNKDYVDLEDPVEEKTIAQKNIAIAKNICVIYVAVS